MSPSTSTRRISTITVCRTLNDSVSTSNFTTSVNPFLNNLDQNLTNSTFTFYGANKPTGTIDIAKVVPDYSAYGKIAQLNYFLNLSNVDRLATQTSISKDSANKELTRAGSSIPPTSTDPR